ncbi:MAG TPA: penicillin-binding protein 1C, partial [Aliiroseovarius sp.]|nr:penicillin-binding protein 1C [Aliiroseovarius sp.]
MRPLRARWFFGLAGLLLATAGLRDEFDDWVAATDLPPLSIATSVEVRDRAGVLLRAYTVEDGRWRLRVTPEAVDPGFIRMLLAFEDKRFYRHHGVDTRALARAAWQALRHGRVVSGGSTLTRQGARLLEEGPTGRIDGKIRQIRLALALERKLSKEDILALYLNRAPYGGNLEGVRAATLAYFGKEPRRLTESEAALLVALPQSPSRRRPDLAHDIALSALDKVLARSGRAGAISQDAATAAMRDPIPHSRQDFPALAPHLTDRLAGATPEIARHDLTIDADLQTRIEALAARAAADHGARLSVAIMVLDHRNGDVLASVGSAGYRVDTRQGFVDMTRAARS